MTNNPKKQKTATMLATTALVGAFTPPPDGPFSGPPSGPCVPASQNRGYTVDGDGKTPGKKKRASSHKTTEKRKRANRKKKKRKRKS